jgi:hypothetical protein
MEDDVAASVQADTEVEAESVEEELLAADQKGEGVTDGTSNT